MQLTEHLAQVLATLRELNQSGSLSFVSWIPRQLQQVEFQAGLQLQSPDEWFHLQPFVTRCAFHQVALAPSAREKTMPDLARQG